jgi:hypothetical protein
VTTRSKIISTTIDGWIEAKVAQQSASLSIDGRVDAHMFISDPWKRLRAQQWQPSCTFATGPLPLPARILLLALLTEGRSEKEIPSGLRGPWGWETAYLQGDGYNRIIGSLDGKLAADWPGKPVGEGREASDEPLAPWLPAWPTTARGSGPTTGRGLRDACGSLAPWRLGPVGSPLRSGSGGQSPVRFPTDIQRGPARSTLGISQMASGCCSAHRGG